MQQSKCGGRCAEIGTSPRFANSIHRLGTKLDPPLCRQPPVVRSPVGLAPNACAGLFTGSTLFLVVHHRRIISGMKLKQSNPYLKSAADRKATLPISAETSSAVEGI